jgi:hypothetical protein
MADKTATLSDKYMIKQCYVVFTFTTSVYAMNIYAQCMQHIK